MDFANDLTWEKGGAIAGLVLAFFDAIGRRDIVQGILQVLLISMLATIIGTYLVADFLFSEIPSWQTFAKEWSLRSYGQSVVQSLASSIVIFVLFAILAMPFYILLKLSETRGLVAVVGFGLAVASLWFEYANN